MLKYIIIIIPLALLSFGLVTACVLMEKSEISTYNSCNNCKANGCEYKPKWGEAVRWNCPLWKGADDETNNN